MDGGREGPRGGGRVVRGGEVGFEGGGEGAVRGEAGGDEDAELFGHEGDAGEEFPGERG